MYVGANGASQMLSEALNVEKKFRSSECLTRMSTRSRERMDPDSEGFAGYV
jgi:hypothetical protein